jgi:hypothetical protein
MNAICKPSPRVTAPELGPHRSRLPAGLFDMGLKVSVESLDQELLMGEPLFGRELLQPSMACGVQGHCKLVSGGVGFARRRHTSGKGSGIAHRVLWHKGASAAMRLGFTIGKGDALLH